MNTRTLPINVIPIMYWSKIKSIKCKLHETNIKSNNFFSTLKNNKMRCADVFGRLLSNVRKHRTLKRLVQFIFIWLK